MPQQLSNVMALFSIRIVLSGHYCCTNLPFRIQPHTQVVSCFAQHSKHPSLAVVSSLASFCCSLPTPRNARFARRLGIHTSAKTRAHASSKF